MTFETMICPVCGGESQIEAGRKAVCPYCAKELNTSASDQGFAFAPQPDVQFAQQQFAQPNVQFAPPPAQMTPQIQPQTAPMPVPQMQQGQFVMQTPQVSPAVLAEAQSKRRNWYLINTALIAAQTLMMALGILFTVFGLRIGVPLILAWVLTLPGFGALSALTRPDHAYIDKKPFSKSKFGQGITQLWLGAAISSAVGGILFAIIAGLLGLY